MTAAVQPEAPADYDIDADIAQVIAACGGDAWAAVRVLLVANADLEAEVERLVDAVSTGFLRGQIRPAEAGPGGGGTNG